MMHSNSVGSRPASGSERGVAMVIVISILVTMLLIAVPFAVSMRQGEERTEAVAARHRANADAQVLSDLVKAYLQGSRPEREEAIRARQPGTTSVEGDPNVDSLAEITPDERFRSKAAEIILEQWAKDPSMSARAASLRSRGLGPLNDDHGSIWSVLVQDAQARVNINSGSVFLLGNIMGAAVLADDLDTGATDIPVTNLVAPTAGFPGFQKENGYIRIGREVISYTSFDGETFRGCTRSAIQDTPLGDNGTPMEYAKGDPVIDYVAYKIATHMIASKPGEVRRFRTVEELKNIATWGEGGTITSDRLEQVRPYLTAFSRRETASGWLAEQLVTNQLPESVDGAGGDVVKIQDQANPTGTSWYVNPGSLVRITDGVNTTYQTVNNLGDLDGRQRGRQFALSGSVSSQGEDFTFEGGETRISVFAPYPININTASQEVLYAVMANIQLWRAKEEEQIVTPKLAWTLAETIVRERKGALEIDRDSGERQKGPFRHVADFGKFLKRMVREGTLKRAQEAALYFNAINPHCSEIRFGTAPWCFRTLDVYHVETRVALNNRVGEQIAVAGTREVVEIGSDTTSVWSVDSQIEFEERLSQGHGAKWTTTFPYNIVFKNQAVAHIQPGVRGPQQFIRGIFPSDERDEDLGDVRLEPARMRLPGAQVVENFDSRYYANGHYTTYDGAYREPTNKTLMGPRDELVRPFKMSFWWRSYSNGNWTAFDCAMEKFENRFAIFVTDGEDGGQELVFRCCSSAMEDRGAEVYVPLERIGYEAGNWYHIDVSCRGEDPSTMQLLVDGIDVGIRRSFTYLTSGLSLDANGVTVESTAGFPPRGALRIGTEILEYELISGGTSFTEVKRGARGTIAGDWPNGTPVHALGYSLPITVDVMKGGATLNEALGKWRGARVTSSDPGSQITVVTGGGNNPPIPYIFEGYMPETKTASLTVEGMWGIPVEECVAGFPSSGYALLGCYDVSKDVLQGLADATVPGEVKLFGWEVVFYERNGSNFEVERYQETAFQGEAEPYYLATKITLPGGTIQDFASYLIPISVKGSGGAGADDYLNPLLEQDREVLSRYYSGGESGRVLLGSDTNETEDQFEVIRYDSIDTARSGGEIHFIRDRNLSSLTGEFFNETAQIPGGTAGGVETASGGSSTPNPTDDPSEETPEPEEPTGESDDEVEEEGSEHVEEGADQSDSSSGDGSGGAQPLPEEPTEDDSGGGEAETSLEEGTEEELIPNQPDQELLEDDIDEVIDPDLLVFPPAKTEDDPGANERRGPQAALRRLQFRGMNRTVHRDHNGSSGDRNSKFLPCFRISETATGTNPPTRVGRNDRITVTDGRADEAIRYEIGIRWGDQGSDWVAPEDFPPERIAAAESGANIRRTDWRGYPRIMKFPTGELPDRMSNEIEFGQSTVSDSGLVTAFLDDLHIWRQQLDPPLIVVNSELISENEDEIYVVNPVNLRSVEDYDGFNKEGGLLMLEGEAIFYRGHRIEGERTMVFERCERGVMGTRARSHAPGTNLRLLADIPVATLAGGLAPDSAAIPLTQARTWPNAGLARIVADDTVELAHFTRKAGNDLLMPESLDADRRSRGRGLFRGRFGTDTMSHESDQLVFFHPYRYWHRYAPRAAEDGDAFPGVHDHPETSYLEIGKKVHSGFWRGFTWQENLLGSNRASGGSYNSSIGDRSGNLDLVVLARFNSNVQWDSSRVVDLRDAGSQFGGAPDLSKKAVDHLFVFDTRGDGIIGDGLRGHPLGVESDTAEFRIYFDYKPNSYEAMDFAPTSGSSLEDERIFVNDWKTTPWLQSFKASFVSRTKTRYRVPVR